MVELIYERHKNYFKLLLKNIFFLCDTKCIVRQTTDISLSTRGSKKKTISMVKAAVIYCLPKKCQIYGPLCCFSPPCSRRVSNFVTPDYIPEQIIPF